MMTGSEPATKSLKLPLQTTCGDGGLRGIPTERSISSLAWVFLLLSTAGTFAAFMLLDPEPSLLLSVCAAANVAIILWAIYRLYAWNLLLSPMASVVMGPGWILSYSWGNLGARIAGEGRYGGNPGSLDFYPEAALLTTIGLVLFCWVVFGLFSQQARYRRIRYEDLVWKPWQALATGLVAAAILWYLSLKYEFINGYFRDVASHFDRWLSGTHYFFVLLALITSVSVIVRGKLISDRVLGVLGVIFPLVAALGLRSRNFMLMAVLTVAVCWVTLQPHKVRSVLLLGVVAVIVLFTLGSVVKRASVRGQTSSIWENLLVVRNLDLQTVIEQSLASAAMDSQYRLAGFEYPATILICLERGAVPMYGEGLIGGLLSGLPGFLRPPGEISERIAIFRHFYGRGLTHGNTIGVPLTTGLADGGMILGLLIYAVIALYCLMVWRVAQASPRLFIAYLIVGAGPGDLFWENAAFAVKAIGFTWLALGLLGLVLMPRWYPASSSLDKKSPCLNRKMA